MRTIRSRGAWLAAGVLVAGVAGAVPASAEGPTTYTLSGTVTDAVGTPVDFDRIEVRRETTRDDPIAVWDEQDGVTYAELPEVHPDGTATGHYAVALTPGHYRVDVHDVPRDGSIDRTSVSMVVITDHDDPHDVQLRPTFACTSPGTITGTAQVGSSLLAHPGSFSPDYAHRLTYQWWRRDPAGGDHAWSIVRGARDVSYALTAADAGLQLEADVSGLSDYGYARCDFTDSDVVTPAPGWATIGTPPGPRTFDVVSPGRPTGRARVGGTLGAPALALPAGTTVRYQWFRVAPHRAVARAIAGARAARYRVRPSDRRARVFVRLELGASGYAGATVTSERVVVR